MNKPFTTLVGEYMALAFVLPATTFVGYAIGYLLDRAFGTHYLYIVFLFVGIAGGFIELIRKLMQDTRDNDR